MNRNVLFVDDDLNILAAFRRQLRNEIWIETASSAHEGLEILQDRNPFAVVVADLRMPEMNGIEFLSLVRKHHSNTVRIMLTGNADLESAIQAVNEGNLFRFLTKPCSKEVLLKAVEDGLRQYHLVTAERELLEHTLSGSVQILTEVLNMLNPEAFSRASRVRLIVHNMAIHLKLEEAWQVELAAMLSQIGCVTLPQDILRKIYSEEPLTEQEKKLYEDHPRIGAQLLANIPRLESIARIIAAQHHVAKGAKVDSSVSDPISAGAEILRIALDFDRLLRSGLSFRDAISRMRTRQFSYRSELLDALFAASSFHLEQPYRTAALPVTEIKTGMVVGMDVRAKSGLMLIRKGQEVTLPILVRLQNFSRTIGVQEPIQVLIWNEPENQDDASQQNPSNPQGSISSG